MTTILSMGKEHELSSVFGRIIGDVWHTMNVNINPMETEKQLEIFKFSQIMLAVNNLLFS